MMKLNYYEISFYALIFLGQGKKIPIGRGSFSSTFISERRKYNITISIYKAFIKSHRDLKDVVSLRIVQNHQQRHIENRMY
jgi:hypothetical protein